MRKIMVVMGALLLICCEDPYKGQLFRTDNQQAIGDWLDTRPEYSLWVKMLRKADLFNALNVGESMFTCFVADNQAVQSYLAKYTDYASVDEMTQEEADFLMRYHILVGGKVPSGNLLLKLSYPTATGDYLTAALDNQTNDRYIDNGKGKDRSYVTQKDILANNGVIHVIGTMLQPLTETVWDLVETNPDYSIFADAVRACELDKWLDETYREIGTTTVRDNKTVFVVSNKVYNEKGINSLDELKARVGGGDPTDSESGLNRYVVYHIMNKLNSYTELTTFPTGYRSMILYGHSDVKGYSIEDTGGQIVFNPQEEDKKFHIVDANRDVPARNGYLHEIDNLGELPAQMAHFVVEWEPTDMIQFTVIPFYRTKKIENDASQKYFLKSGEIPGIRWESIPAAAAQVWYYSAYVDGGRYLNSDALYWNVGVIGWLEMDTPVLPIGAYKMTVEKSNDASYGGKCNVLWGEVVMGDEKNFVNGTKVGTWESRTLTMEEVHTIRFSVGSVPGIIGIDRFTFKPE